MPTEPTLADRLVSLLDHLGLSRAHWATQMPGDLTDFAERNGDRIASLVFAVPVRLDPGPFTKLADRILVVTGDAGVSVAPSERAVARLAGSRLHKLAGYETTGWSDVAKERTAELAEAIHTHLARCDVPASMPADAIRTGASRIGSHAGISYRIDGRGPALILMPFFLAPSQWDPVVPELARDFTVIRIGGAHIGGIAILEDRAARPSYKSMFRSLLHTMRLPNDAHVLDVGCGSGALSRIAATHLGAEGHVDAIDLNAFMLSEARDLARSAGLGDRIAFKEGSAEAIPFPDATFDGAYSVTVLEECNADRAIAELKRVVKPGGAIGVIVRAIDMPQWWSLDVPASIATRANEAPQSVGHGGVADKSLYTRLLKAGLVDLVPFPALVTLDNPGSTVWRYREDHLLALLDRAELQAWERAREVARASGALFQSHAMHCAVARKP